ncbi:MAG: hypothetical protein Q8938_11685 [Bacteroidota bacterium]|nr:hypothetical protein [Bacteroidota bacterium]
MKIYLITMALLNLIHCELRAQQEKGHSRSFTVAELRAKLDSAMKGDTEARLGRFFQEWHKASVPNDQAAIHQNDTTEALYDVFKCFYKPFDMVKLGVLDWDGNRRNSKTRYIAVQGEVHYSILPVDSVSEMVNSKKVRIDKRDDFRPPIAVEGSMVLYLMPEYYEAINAFLGGSSKRGSNGNKMVDSMEATQCKKRFTLLKGWLPIAEGDCSSTTQLETYPFVEGIKFNRNLSLAIVSFWAGGDFGRCLLAKRDGGWVIEESDVRPRN